jgi:transposase
MARLFKVSVASVVKWSQRKRRTGSAAASPMGWRNRPLRLAGERAWLLERLAAQPDLTLRGVQGELAARGMRVRCKAIWNFFRAEKLTFKKKPARRRAGSTGRGASAGPMEEVSGPD